VKCRHCQHELTNVFIDLGRAPPSNAYLDASQCAQPEVEYPLRIMVCDACFLVQTEDFVAANKLFDHEYAYFSSVSQSWLAHAKNYCSMITKRLGLNAQSYVVEIASNDGYLLKNMVANGIPCLGIEPTASTAAAAEKHGIPVLQAFFGEQLAQQQVAHGKAADLIIGNNVYAHVPDINDFTRGLKILLKPGGTITLEFPHLMQMVAQGQFDTAYHEHFSYFSLGVVARMFAAVGLRVFDVETLPTHGGSLRIYGCHAADDRASMPAVDAVLAEEIRQGLSDIATYRRFQSFAEQIRDRFVHFLEESRRAGKNVAAYGAAAKGNTLLNFAHIKKGLISYVYDAAPSKQGKFMPGSHIEIAPPALIRQHKPDILIIFPWNLADEVLAQNHYVREWGCQFVTVIPDIQFL
jgi:2-polyprenyl-3-methyl-5-hydroxy-6-metoxy-1,4-benzoquinol methylase